VRSSKREAKKNRKTERKIGSQEQEAESLRAWEYYDEELKSDLIKI
jgi:hypothetical protein